MHSCSVPHKNEECQCYRPWRAALYRNGLHVQLAKVPIGGKFGSCSVPGGLWNRPVFVHVLRCLTYTCRIGTCRKRIYWCVRFTRVFTPLFSWCTAWQGCRLQCLDLIGASWEMLPTERSSSSPCCRGLCNWEAKSQRHPKEEVNDWCPMARWVRDLLTIGSYSLIGCLLITAICGRRYTPYSHFIHHLPLKHQSSLRSGVGFSEDRKHMQGMPRVGGSVGPTDYLANQWPSSVRTDKISVT
ncbi:hypothetical protein EDD15DRAFT_1807580 [Pisolithus albus]|nr:hypothetical protein EDD15DRAFT_1807580 [Pisolithus albus]